MHTAEVKGYVYGVINRQKYKFPVFIGKITHAQTVCTRPFLLPSKCLGTRLTRKLWYLCTCMYVCSDTSSTCSSCSMRMNILQFGKDHQCRSHELTKAGELNSCMNSQQVIAGRDLGNRCLKGRRSKLKQYTSLQSYYDCSLNNQRLRCCVEATVLNLYRALCLHVQLGATDCY